MMWIFCPLTFPSLPISLLSHTKRSCHGPSAPIAYPIARLLDLVLGAHSTHTYRKAELKSFLQFHKTGEEPLRDDEIAILNGVLELNTKNVETIMTPMEDVMCLSADTILDHETVDYM